jgi:hypothetical protein
MADPPINVQLDRTMREGATYASELRRMAALCGLQDPFSYRPAPELTLAEVGALPWRWDPDRCSGRSTRMLLSLLLAVEFGHEVRIVAGHAVLERELRTRAQEMARRAGLNSRRIRQGVSAHQIEALRGYRHLVFVDHDVGRVLLPELGQVRAW